MKEKRFRAFIAEGKRVKKDLSESEIRSNIRVVREFERFLKAKSPPKDFARATKRDLEGFVRQLTKTGRNTEENVIAILRYARFVDSKAMEKATLEMLDGALVMDILSDMIKSRVGPEKHEKLYRGITFPSIGSSFKSWPKVTKKLMERFESDLDESVWKGALLAGPHTIPDEYFYPEKKKFKDAGGVDEYLKIRRDEFLALLKQLKDEGSLFYTQEIDDSVLDFVRRNKEVAGGVRRGDTIYEMKIPYMTREYLREKDPIMKRYLACHCPWVREAIKSGLNVSPNFCYCSAAYHKKPFEVVFGEPLEVKVVSSVLAGDSFCRFAIKIPKKHRVKRKARS
jgi:hypothetical protein